MWYGRQYVDGDSVFNTISFCIFALLWILVGRCWLWTVPWRQNVYQFAKKDDNVPLVVQSNLIYIRMKFNILPFHYDLLIFIFAVFYQKLGERGCVWHLYGVLYLNKLKPYKKSVRSLTKQIAKLSKWTYLPCPMGVAHEHQITAPFKN